jgi:hypothetical protein
MENKKSPTDGGKKSNGSNKLWLILFLLAAAFNIYQWMNHSSSMENRDVEADSLSTVAINLEKELGETYAELNQYKGTSEELDSLLTEANLSIEEQRKKIEKLLRSESNSKARNKKLQAELDNLKKLREEYLEKIDELLVENQNLKKSNEDLITKNAEITRNLETTVNQAAVLRSEYIKSSAAKMRKSGKFVETALAKRTNKMEVCFSILDNSLATAGEKKVYLRIVEPGGKTLGSRSEGSSTFTVQATGEVVQFTAMKSVNYINERQDLCMDWVEQERTYTAGTYAIEIYIDGTLSASSSHTLR